MSGIIAVYGLVVSVLIAGGCKSSILLPYRIEAFLPVSILVKPTDYSLFQGFIHLGAGLACGFTGLAAGYAIGFVGDSVRQHHLTGEAHLTTTCSVCEHTSMSQKCSCLWSSSLFSARCLVCTGECLTMCECLECRTQILSMQTNRRAHYELESWW